VTPKEAKRKRKEQEKEIMKRQKQQEQTKQESDEIEQLVAKQESLIKTDELGITKPNITYPEETPSFFNQRTNASFSSSTSSLDNNKHQNNLNENHKLHEVQQPHQGHADLLVHPSSSDFLVQNHSTNQGFNSTPQMNNQGVSSINDLLFQSNLQQQQQQHALASNLHSFQENFNRNPLPSFVTQQMNQQFNMKTFQQQQLQHQPQQNQQQQLYMSNAEQQQATASLKLETFSTQGSIGSIVPPTFTKSLPFMNLPAENDRISSASQFQNPIIPQQQQPQQQQQQQSLSLTVILIYNRLYFYISDSVFFNFFKSVNKCYRPKKCLVVLIACLGLTKLRFLALLRVREITRVQIKVL